ncbi:Meiotically up-regulated protein 86 protein [Lecanora helva]
MSTTANTDHTGNAPQDYNKETNGGMGAHREMSHEEHQTAKAAARFGYGPLAHVNTQTDRLPAFGGEAQPGLYKQVKNRGFANPAPLGLSAFALTTFVLGLINMGTRGLSEPNLVVGIAFGYGGLVQLLAGMWEMAVGNTFGATALSSYGGFWLSFAIILTPGGFQIQDQLSTAGPTAFDDEFGLYLMGWFIFTFILVLCTLRSTVAFFSLFFSLDLAFMLLGIGYLHRDAMGMPNPPIIKAGGFFALMAAFLAWYNALAGIADDSNRYVIPDSCLEKYRKLFLVTDWVFFSFFIIPVAHFPWSVTGMKRSGKMDEEGNKTA